MSGGASRRPRLGRSLRMRVPATAMAVFAVSLAVASVLAYELLLQDGRRDIDVVIAREQERFQLSMTELLAEIQDEQPELAPIDALRASVRRYLQLNPSNSSYWTIVTFADGAPLAAANGPPELEPLFRAGELPQGRLEIREDVATAAGTIRTSSVPVLLAGEQVATLQIVSPLAPVAAEAREAAWLVVAAAGVTLLLGGILLTASLWRSLTPLGALADAARDTELRSLDARVEVPEADDEVGVLAREFNTMLARLEQATAAQQAFMASVGHELRTPITIARGHLELLQTLARRGHDGTARADDPAGLTETLAILQDELQRMGRLVDDLMAIARADMEDFVRPRSLELVQWFEEFELRLAGLPDGSDVRCEPPPPVVLDADPDRLAQAVLNLVTNALVHTPPATPVRVRAEVTRDRVTVVVADTGPGIPESIREEAFTPFVHAGEVPTSTGLGLSVVRAVARAHGGEVLLDTGPAGTTVGLRLPWSPSPDDLALLTDEGASDEGAPAEPDRTAAGPGTAGDDPAVREADDTLPLPTAATTSGSSTADAVTAPVRRAR